VDLKGKMCESVDWIHLAQDGIEWQALMNTAINIFVSQKARHFLTS
jgi:hypothetical protein